MKHAFTIGSINGIMASVIYCMQRCYIQQDPARAISQVAGCSTLRWLHLYMQDIMQTCNSAACAVCKYSTVSNGPNV